MLLLVTAPGRPDLIEGSSSPGRSEGTERVPADDIGLVAVCSGIPNTSSVLRDVPRARFWDLSRLLGSNVPAGGLVRRAAVGEPLGSALQRCATSFGEGCSAGRPV